MNKVMYLATVLAVAACATSDVETPTTSSKAFHVERRDLSKDGVPFLVQGHLGGITSSITTLETVDEAMAAALPGIGRAIQVPSDQLVARRVQHDSIGMTHVRYGQRANGLEVVAGDVVVHIGADGTIKSVTNATRDASGLPTVPGISAAAAQELARTKIPTAVSSTTPDLVYVVTNAEGNIRLAWRSDVRGQMLHDTVYVDAMTGAIAYRQPHIQSARNRTVFINGVAPSGQPPVQGGTLAGTEGSPPTNQSGLFAYDNTGTTYDCYKTLYDRDSYDDAGAELISYAATTAGGGQGFDNAFWDGQEMVYSIGDSGSNPTFGDFAKALDVTAHELTHAVTGATSNLNYQNGESGGLNEASSDILSATCEAQRDGKVSDNTWLVGEDIFTPNTPGDALRFMSDPSKDAAIYPPGQGLVSLDFFGDYDDSIDVHFTSGIANLFFYLLSEGGKHPHNKTTFTVNGVGIEKAGKIWYRADTNYFTENTHYMQARTLTEMAANELFPGATKTVVGLAWATVGVGTAPTDNVAPTITITAPSDTDIVEEGFTITANAADDQGIVRVDFSIDGEVVGSATEAPYSFKTATNVAFGQHVIEATAYDAVNTTSDMLTVKLIDPTCGNSCLAGQMCDMEIGACVEVVESGGCCSTGSGPGSSLVLFAIGGAFVMRRRRRSAN